MMLPTSPDFSESSSILATSSAHEWY